MGARWRSVLQPRWRQRPSHSGARRARIRVWLGAGMSPIERNVVPPNFPHTFSNIIAHDNICLECSSSNR
jgi:hypothetical protein